MPIYPVPLGDSCETLEVRAKGLGIRLWFRGEKLKPKEKFGFRSYRWIEVQGADGQTYHIAIKPSFWDSLPTLIINGDKSDYRPPLPLWAKVVMGASLLLVALSLPLNACFPGCSAVALVGAIPLTFAQIGARAIENDAVGAALALGSLALMAGVWGIIAFAALGACSVRA